VRDAAIPGRVTTTDWMLASGGVVAALAFTYIGLFLNWDEIGTSLGLTIWTALTFSLFSTMFFVRTQAAALITPIHPPPPLHVSAPVV
jgi:hypothetical protein